MTNPESGSRALLNRLKSAGGVLLAIVIFLAVIAVFGVLLGAADWLSEKLLPWFARISVLGFFVVILIMLPLSLIRRMRSFSSTAILIISFVFGATAWMEGLVLTMTTWGPGAVVLGLLFMGVGIVPIALLATLFHGMWSLLAELVVLIVLTFGSRFLSIWIGETAGS